jgi:hypothetical protein
LKEQYNLNIISVSKDNFIKILCDKCNKEYDISTSLLYLRYNRYNIETCLHCNPLNDFRSSYEKELSEILFKYNINMILNDRKTVCKNELDIYLPDYKIAIIV